MHKTLGLILSNAKINRRRRRKIAYAQNSLPPTNFR
jgi:hypothetical protein